MTEKDKSLAIGIASMILATLDGLAVRFVGQTIGTASCLLLLALASFATVLGVIGIENGK